MLIFITGGCRSGKSTLALELAKKAKGRTAFVATAVGLDAEMRARIRKHKEERPDGWTTFEQPHGLEKLLAKAGKDFDTVIIDCVTIYLANQLVRKHSPAKIEEEMSGVIREIRQSRCRFIIVSNEVGMGIVPPTALGRKFRDLAGEVNKRLAAAADQMYFMVSGMKLKIK